MEGLNQNPVSQCLRDWKRRYAVMKGDEWKKVRGLWSYGVAIRLQGDKWISLRSGLTPEQCFPTDAVGPDKVLHSLRKQINRKTGASQSECFQYTKLTGKNTFQIQHCIPKQKHDCAKQCAPRKCIGWPS
jgi:hypothetical protein